MEDVRLPTTRSGKEPTVRLLRLRIRAPLDWAELIKSLVDEDYDKRVVLVMDKGEAFEPAEARRIAERLEIHYTPKHGDLAVLGPAHPGPRLSAQRGQGRKRGRTSLRPKRRHHAIGSPVWRITQVSHKPFPTGRAAHGGLDGILQLRAAHGLRADDVARLTLAAPPLIHQLVGRPVQPDMDVTYARLCFQYVGALALLHGGVDVADFSPERLADPRWRDLARRIELVADGNPDPNALAPQAVTAHLKDGRTLRVGVPHTLGSPERPLSREQHLAKFRRCWSYGAQPLAAAAADRLIHLVDRPGRSGQFQRAGRPDTPCRALIGGQEVRKVGFAQRKPTQPTCMTK